MKRIVCLMLIVSIACVGCEVSNKHPVMGTHETIIGIQGVGISLSELMQRIKNLEKLYGEIKISPKNKALLARVSELGTEIDSLRTELKASVRKLKEEAAKAKITQKQDKNLLVRKIADIETVLESQRTELRENITMLKTELSENEIMPEQYETLLGTIDDIDAEMELQRVEERADKLLLVKIADLEAELESRRQEKKSEKALLVRIADLEATIESQKAEIESSKNAYRLYEVAIESQKATIESLEKLCRMYEDAMSYPWEAFKY